MTKRWLDEETANRQIAKAKAGWRDAYLPDDPAPDPGPESKLQAKIVRYCKDNGYPCLSFRQSRHAKGFLTPGMPDIVIALPDSKTVWIELKSAEGYLREDQKQIALQLMALGHAWYQIRSYKKFIEIIEKGPKGPITEE